MDRRRLERRDLPVHVVQGVGPGDAEGKVVKLVARRLHSRSDHRRREEGHVDLEVVHEAVHHADLSGVGMTRVENDPRRRQRAGRERKQVPVHGNGLPVGDAPRDHPRHASVDAVFEVTDEHPRHVSEPGMPHALAQRCGGTVDRLVRASPQATSELRAALTVTLRRVERRDSGATEVELLITLQPVAPRMVPVPQPLRMRIERERRQVAVIVRNELLQIVSHRANADPL